MNLPIRCSRYKFLFNLIVVAQRVNGGPQGPGGGGMMRGNNGQGGGEIGRGSTGQGGDEIGRGSNGQGGAEVSRGGQGWIAADPPGTYPGYPSQPDGLPPPNPPYIGNLSIPPSPTLDSSCKVCTISVSSISLYYWPQKSTNTACLATIPPQPTPTYPPGLNPIYPSAYALFFSVTVNDACGFTVSYPVSTASFHSDALSTLDSQGRIERFDLADLPCPPPSVNLQPGQPFKPNFAWNTELFFKQNTEPSRCKTMTGLNAWPDPPKALPTVKGGLPAPTPGSPPRARPRREPANAHVAPWIPGKTLMP